jgi:hypothetical protein
MAQTLLADGWLMGEALKVLGQAAPVANVQTDLYTVPAATSATVSTLQVCNQAGTKAEFRVRVRVNGAADHAKQFLYFDQALLAKDTFTATIGLTLGAGDVVSVQSDSGSVSFNLFGVEVT